MTASAAGGPTDGLAPASTARPLDTVERFWFVRGLLGSAICVGAALVEGPLDGPAVRVAARRLLRRHPALGARIVDPDAPRFEAAGLLDPPVRVVEAVGPVGRADGPEAPGGAGSGGGPRGWQAVVEEEARLPFDAARGPLWRVAVVLGDGGEARHAVILAVHHSLIDGHSHLRLVEDLVLGCRETIGRASPADDRATATPPPIAAAAGAAGAANAGAQPPPPPGLPLDQAIELTPRLGPPPAPRTRRIFPIEGRAAPSERTTRFLAHDLDPEASARLKDRVRRERTTVHAALCVGALVAAQRLAGPLAGFQLISPVSLRALCRPPVGGDRIGCYSSGLALEIDLPEPVSSFWERVRALHRQLLGAIGEQRWRMAPLASAADLRAAGEQVAATAADDATQGRLGDVLVSSAGDVAAEAARGALRVVRYYEVASQHVAGHHFALWPHGVDGTLCLALGYTAPVTTTAYAARFLEALVRALDEACAAP